MMYRDIFLLILKLKVQTKNINIQWKCCQHTHKFTKIILHHQIIEFNLSLPIHDTFGSLVLFQMVDVSAECFKIQKKKIINY